MVYYDYSWYFRICQCFTSVFGLFLVLDLAYFIFGFGNVINIQLFWISEQFDF